MHSVEARRVGQQLNKRGRIPTPLGVSGDEWNGAGLISSAATVIVRFVDNPRATGSLFLKRPLNSE